MPTPFGHRLVVGGVDPLYLALLGLLFEVLMRTKENINRIYFQQLANLVSADRALCRSPPRTEARRSFESIASSLGNVKFRKLFRMERSSFDELCTQIKRRIGEENFKGEDWLLSAQGKSRRTVAATDYFGGIISGEIKVAIMIRFLSGGSYLDIGMVYDVSDAAVYKSFHEAIGWIIATFNFPLAEWLEKKDEDALNRVAESFGQATDGAFGKCIGALDGLAVKIRSPSLTERILDPGNYYCRKGFFALNVQAICDKDRTGAITQNKGVLPNSNRRYK
jgi:hypothetical protein